MPRSTFPKNAPRVVLGSTLMILSLAGCVTSQENPNYQYSSRYQEPAAIQTARMEAASAAVTTDASYELPVEIVYADSYPVAEPVPYQAPNTSVYVDAPQTSLAGAPTDIEFVGENVSGTPGYMAIMGTTEYVAPQTTEPATSAPSAGVAIDYDYSANLIATDAAAPFSLNDDVRILPQVPVATGNYVVKAGDTVYGLSKRFCVGVADIQSLNQIDGSFAIKIGQQITLPAAGC